MLTTRSARRAAAIGAAVARGAAAACLMIALAACDAEEDLDGAGAPLPNGSDLSGTPQASGAAVIGVTDKTAAALAQDALGMVSRLIIVGNVASTIVREHVGLLEGGVFDAERITACAGSPDGYDTETNEVSHREISPGFTLPGGTSLRAAFSNCTIDGALISGFLDIAAISLTGDPGGPGDWQVQAWLALYPIEIYHANGTFTAITDQIQLTLTMSGGVLTMTLSIDADETAGMIGGLNAQHGAYPMTSSTPTVNYQFRPFRIRTVEDAGADVYTVAIETHPEGPSTLSRYTTSPDAEVLVEVETAPGTPVTWEGGRPTTFTQTPVSGEIRLAETCGGCGSMLVTVEDDGVTLTVEAGASVTSEFHAWETLLSAPEAP